jgi:SHS2 domain-containing protein
MPYAYREEIATADVAFEAWDETVEGMFAMAADALLNVMVEDPAAVQPAESVEIRLEEEDLDLLLFGFLNELVYLKDARQLLLRAREIALTGGEGGWSLAAVMAGEKIDPPRHRMSVDVKAVTLHLFSVGRTERGWEARVVVDI